MSFYDSFFLFCETQIGVVWRMLVNKECWLPLTIICKGKKHWGISQNIFNVPKKKESHKGLKQHEGELKKTNKFLGLTDMCFSGLRPILIITDQVDR